MSIIYIKQALKTKVNRKDTEKAIVKNIASVLGTDDIEYVTIKTDDIDKVKAGSHLILASDTGLTKYVAISCGTSTKDIECLTDDGEQVTYHFEYVLMIDKKVCNGKRVNELMEEAKTNKDLAEALNMAGFIATNARYDTLISGQYGKLNKTNNRYNGLLVIDYTDENGKDIEFDVVGRKGKLHLMRLVPALQDEIDVIGYIEDPVMTEICTVGMIKDNKGIFSNRKKPFNFANVLPVDKIDDTLCEKLGLRRDSKGNILISNLKDLESYMELYSDNGDK